MIVTAPLGVLAAGGIAFEPALPSLHQEAIAGLGMGLLDKVWLRFDTAFWREEALMWTRVAPGNPFREWFNLRPATGEPILLALLGGDEAREWAARSDEDVMTAAVQALQAFADAGGERVLAWPAAAPEGDPAAVPSGWLSRPRLPVAPRAPGAQVMMAPTQRRARAEYREEVAVGGP